MLLLLAFFLGTADLANLRLVSTHFNWVEKIIFKMIHIKTGPDLVHRAQSFMSARSTPLTIRGLSFTSIFARVPIRGYSTWGVLKQAIPVLFSRGEVAKVETIKMPTASTDIVPLLGIMNRCGVTTIKRLELHHFIGFRGAYAREAASITDLLAGIESMHISFDFRVALSVRNADFAAFMAWLAANCCNLKIFEVLNCLGVEWLPQVFIPPFNTAFGQANFQQLRSILISDVLLDGASIHLLLFTSSEVLEVVKLHRVRFQAIYWNPFIPQDNYAGTYREDLYSWTLLICEFHSKYRNTRTQMEIWRPFKIVSDNGQPDWVEARDLRSWSLVVKVLAWDDVAAEVST